MSCPRESEVERTLTAAQLHAFCIHARECADCGRHLDRVAVAYRALRAEPVPALSPARRVELRHRIDAEIEKPRLDRRLLIAALAAALAGAAVLVLWPASPGVPRMIRDGESVGLPSNQRVSVAPASRVVFGAASLEIERESTLSFEPGPELTGLSMEEGRVRFEVSPVSPARPFAVSTPLARFEVLGTRFVLDVSPERVELNVEDGRVRMVPADGQPPREVSSGQIVIIEKKRKEKSEPIASAPPPPPAPRKRSRPPVARRAPPARKIPEPAVTATAQVRLDQAREVVLHDAARARDLARGVLDEKPAPALEIRALLVLADAERRTGEWRAAAAAYLRVAEHQNGTPYAEEAFLRRAQILAEHADARAALAALEAASRRFPGGALLPERAVLEARLDLEEQHPAAAADALERAGADRTLAVLRARVDVAEALLGTTPARSRALVEPVLKAEVSRDLLGRAQMIVRRAAGNR